MRINTILLLLSLSFVSTISSIEIEDNIITKNSRNLLSIKKNHKAINHPIHHKNIEHKKNNPIKSPIKIKNKNHKKIVKKLTLTKQTNRPEQPKYFFDDIFKGFKDVADFQQTFPAEYFSLASQSFTANTLLVNLRGNKIDPVGYFENGVKNAFNIPGIQFVAIDEINPNSFAPKIKGKYNKKILYSNANLFLQKLKSFGENNIYQGRINLFVTNISPRLFSNYPNYANFIREILRLAQHNYIGIIYSENYRGPITSSFANVCLSSSNNRQGCIDSLNAPINLYEWSSTKNNPKNAINNFRKLMKTLCKECDVNKLVMPTFGLSNQNGVCLNNCFKKNGNCQDDLLKLRSLVKELKDEKHVAFYGAAHVTDTTDLIIQNGDYYNVEALYCEIIVAAYPELNKCS